MAVMLPGIFIKSLGKTWQNVQIITILNAEEMWHNFGIDVLHS